MDHSLQEYSYSLEINVPRCPESYPQSLAWLLRSCFALSFIIIIIIIGIYYNHICILRGVLYRWVVAYLIRGSLDKVVFPTLPGPLDRDLAWANEPVGSHLMDLF